FVRKWGLGEGPVVEAWLKRMYERHRAVYVRASVVGVYLLGLLTAALAGLIGSGVEGLSVHEALIAVGFQELLTLATRPILDHILRPKTRTLTSWAAGDRASIGKAREARNASLELPGSLFMAALRVNCVMAPTLGPLPILLVDHNLVLGNYIALAVGGLLATIQWVISSYFALDLAMRPIAE